MFFKSQLLDIEKKFMYSIATQLGLRFGSLLLNSSEWFYTVMDAEINLRSRSVVHTLRAQM
jgi:hypothetical protein